MNAAVITPITSGIHRAPSTRVAPSTARGSVMNRPSNAESRRTSRAIVSVIEQSPAIAGDRAETSPLSCEHEVLSAKRERGDQALEWTQRAQQMREDEQEIRTHDVETRTSKQTSRLGRRHRDRILVEWYAAHDVARARIPRVVLPQCEHPARHERIVHVRGGRVPLVDGNVVEDAIAEREIERRPDRLVDQRERG